MKIRVQFLRLTFLGNKHPTCVSRFNSLKDNPTDQGSWEGTQERQLGLDQSHQVYVRIEPRTKMATANLNPGTHTEPELNLLLPRTVSSRC